MGFRIHGGLTAEQRAQRLHGIGASDVAAIVGLHKYRGPYQVWASKMGLLPLEEEESLELTDPRRMGHLLEPVIAQLAEDAYSAQYPDRVIVFDALPTLAGGRAPWQLATPDRYVRMYHRAGTDHQAAPIFGDLLETRLVECKAKRWTTFRDFGAEGTDQVPDDVLMQAMWQLDVTRAHQSAIRQTDVPVLVDGSQFAMFTVAYDETFSKDLFDTIAQWRQRHIVEGIEPLPSHAKDVEVLKARYREAKHDLVALTPDIDEAVTEYAKAKRAVKEAEDVCEVWKARVMHLLGDAKSVAATAGKVSWANVKGSVRTDWKTIADVMGAPEELIQQHTTIGASSRQFRFYPAKETK